MMGRGVIIGMVWGVLFSALFLAVISLNAPLPEERAPAASMVEAGDVDTRPELPELAAEDEAPNPLETPEVETPPTNDATAGAPETGGAVEQSETGQGPADNVPLPAGSEFNRPPPDEAAALPVPDQAPDVTPPTGSAAPAPDVLTGSPVPDTASAPLPTATAALDLPQINVPTADGTTPEVTNTDQDPLAPPQELQPAPLGLPQIETDPGAVRLDTIPAAAPVLDQPSESTDPAETSEPEPVEPTDPSPAPLEAAGLSEPRLPRIGGPLPTEVGAETDAEDAASTMPEDIAARPAIEAFAAEFDAAETRPLMAVILIDDPAFGLDRTLLQSFPFPVSFAIDPTRPQAAENAAAYRAAGFEVLMLAEDMLPAGAAPADVEVALAGGFEILPEAVAVLDSDQNRVQGDRPVLDAVISVLQETGHGLVAYPRGLNAAEQSAVRVDVPAATLFRQIDSERERATVITRYLDRAAFAAGQDGSVIVIGHTYSDTVTALFSWALGARSESVAMAPVSAVLTR